MKRHLPKWFVIFIFTLLNAELTFAQVEETINIEDKNNPKSKNLNTVSLVNTFDKSLEPNAKAGGTDKQKTLANIVGVVVTPAPTNVNVDNTLICAGSTVTLTASCGTSDNSPLAPKNSPQISRSGALTASNATTIQPVRWYTQAIGGSIIGEGSPVTHIPLSNVTYYATCVDVNGESSRVASAPVTVTSNTSILFMETFDGVGGPTAGGAGTYKFPNGWFLRNVDNRTPNGSVAYVNDAWERREDFAKNVADSVAFSTSWYSTPGQADDWMWTPLIAGITSSTKLKWNAIAYDPLYPDGYEVRVMTAASGPPTGGSGVIGNQLTNSTQVFNISAENSTWTNREISLAAYAGQSVYIAFRNNSFDQFLLLIDDVIVESGLTPPTTVAVNVSEVCENGTVTLTANCSAGTVNWYNQATGGVMLGTGSPFMHSPTSTTTYYALCNNVCESSRVATNQVTVNLSTIASPTDVNVNDVLACGGSSVVLSASCGSVSSPFAPIESKTGVNESAPSVLSKTGINSIKSTQAVNVLWYTQATGGVSIGSGSPFTATPSATTTYYAACIDGTTESCSRVAAPQVTVMSAAVSPPTAVVVSNTSICLGQSITLSATCALGNIKWYDVATGGASIGGGTSFVYTPTTVTAYYATCEIGNCSSTSVATSVVSFSTITPSGISVSSNAICEGGAVSLFATCSSGSVEWYSALTGGSLLGTGSPFLQSPTSTTIYYAYCNSSCAGSRVASPQVNVISPPNVIANFTVCPGETASLTASCTSGILEWYDSATGGSVLGTTSPFVTPPITTTTSYFAACTNPDTPLINSEVFAYTGAMQTFTVPAGVTSITIEALGAGGGSGSTGGNSATGGVGGKGSKVTGTLAVTPGQVLNIYVGGAGGTPTAGFNGGGTGGSTNSGGGGGASDIRYPGNAVADRIIVAGGGGGGGRAGCESVSVTGGNGGYGDGNGFNGTNAATIGGFAGGGAGAIGFNAGPAGAGCGGFLGSPGGAGLATGLGGAGGAGQACCCFGSPSVPGGGGGGGGYIGGGGGGGGSAGTVGCSGNDKGAGGGGAGGTSYTGGVNAGVVTNDIQAGNGQITISYAATPVSIGCSSNRVEVIVKTVTSPTETTNSTVCIGSTASLSATCPSGNLVWFDSLTGGSILSTTNPFVTSPLLNTTTYYAGCQLFNNGALTSEVFAYTGAMQTFTVPAGVTSITIEALGAGGGSGSTGGNSATGGVGGKGSKVTGTLAVTPGQVLNIYVGGAGGTPTAGFNGGGTGGSTNSGGGGGASDIRYPGNAVADRIIVAGGGGGGGRAGCESVSVTGGNGGYGDGNGFNGTNAATSGGFAGGGAGAIGFNAGPAGAGCGGFLGSPGGAGLATGLGGGGGAGQACCCFGSPSVPGGGGGGGGYIGGGGGGGGSAGTVGCSGNDKGAGGGGAGGTSYTGGVNAGVVTNDIQAGNGQITISYTAGSTVACESVRVPLIVTVTNPAVPTITPPNTLVVCSPSTLVLTASGCAGTVTWSQGGATGSSLTLSAVGTYSISATCTVNGCTSDASSPINGLEIKAQPIITATNTGPYTVGQTINLDGSGGGSYSWIGPNNFSSTISTPSITNALSVNGGIYTLTVTGANGCNTVATTNVVVSGVDPCDPSRIVDYLYVKAGNPYQPLFALTNGAVINQIPDQVSILANPVCSSVTIESMEMNIQGPELNWNIVQNVPPNALFDNSGLDIWGRNFNPGNYTLTVTGYAQDNKGGGITYGPKIIRFTVVGNLATINAPTLSRTTICAGSSLDVTFGTTGTFNGVNQFQVELSDSSGSFANPILIGTTNTIGTITCLIPQNTLGGSKYLIRVISSNQVVVSNPVISQVTVNPLTYSLVSPTNNLTGTGIKKAVNTITASNKIISPANVIYKAGKSVVLTPGFESSAVFRAEVESCEN